MNKKDAKDRLREGMTRGEIATLLASVPADARLGQSVVNPRFTKAQTYEIFCGTYGDPTDTRSAPAEDPGAVSVLREFGDCLTP